MKDFNYPITPRTIVNDNWQFSIPIYQRLFVWGAEQIERLLEDLWMASQSTPTSPYYIGVITAVKQTNASGRVFSVVDGQQRLTFLLLFFSYVNGERGLKFVFVNNDNSKNLRIKFLGRKEDEDDIRQFSNHDKTNEIKNINFRIFNECIERFLATKGDEQKEPFVKYVYDNTSILVNELVGYSNYDLNLYFEKMNSTGRQLSPLDQLKGHFATYAPIWNKCFNFEKVLDESNIEKGNEDGASKELSLDDIIIKYKNLVEDEPIQNRVSNAYSRLLIRPEVLALHVLNLIKGDNVDLSPRYLLKTFNTHSPIDKKTFIDKLVEYRKWIDENIIYLRGENDDGDDGDSDALGLKYAFRDSQKSSNKKLMLQLQSMLYVSSDEKQEWILNAYHGPNDENFNLFNFLENQLGLKNIGTSNMNYPTINRSWFWKLDYLLWKDHHKNWSCKDGKWGKITQCESIYENLSTEEHRAVENYVFRANRSIEHFRPQNGADGEWIKGVDEQWQVLHSFGNLCMISSSFNSTQSDDSINTKCGRIDDQVKSGRLESIKMLVMRKLAGENKEWTPQKAVDHGSDMLKFLGFDSISIAN